MVTVTGTVAELATAAAGMVATTWVEFIHCVLIVAPLKLTVAFELKFDPVTWSVNCELPAAVLGGFSWLMTGLVPAVGGVVDLAE